MRRAAAVGFGALGIVGAAWLIAIGVAEQAVDARRGDLASKLRKGNSQGLAQTAQRLVERGDMTRAAQIARKALLASPINVQASRTLAQSLADSNPVASDRLMLVSAKMGWRDAYTDVWVIQKAIGAAEAQIAMQRAEALVRLDRERDMVPTLLRLLAMDPKGRATMVAALARDPVWRGVFLTHQESLAGSQLAPVVAVLTELRSTRVPPRPEEARPALAALVKQGDVEQAFALHRLLFERGKPLVSNSTFERPGVGFEINSSASPLDWRVMAIGQSSATIAPDRQGSGHVLEATAAGSIEGRIAEQLLVLRPGRYKLSYRVRSTSTAGNEQIRWSLRCPSGLPVLFTAPPASLQPDRWTIRSHVFSVNQECSSQVLELRADPELDGAGVDAEFDNVQVQRLL